MAEPIVPKSFGPPLGMYSHGMAAGDLVIVAGQVGLGIVAVDQRPQHSHDQVKDRCQVDPAGSEIKDRIVGEGAEPCDER